MKMWRKKLKSHSFSVDLLLCVRRDSYFTIFRDIFTSHYADLPTQLELSFRMQFKKATCAISSKALVHRYGCECESGSICEDSEAAVDAAAFNRFHSVSCALATTKCDIIWLEMNIWWRRHSQRRSFIIDAAPANILRHVDGKNRTNGEYRTKRFCFAF